MDDMTAIPKNRQIRLDRLDSSQLLIEKARQGCQESFRQLVLTNQQAVRLFLSRYLHCGSQIDDVAQEAFLTAFQQLENFRGDAKFSTWLLGIARNKALHLVRTEVRRRRKIEKFSEAENWSRKLKWMSENESDIELHDERMDALQSCLSQLPFQSRLLVQRFYFNQESSLAIAADTEEKSGSIRMRLMRIRKVLLACISTKINQASD